MSNNHQLQKLLEEWERQYRQGINLVARQICPDGSSEFILLLQENIDKQRAEIDEEREIKTKEALELWKVMYDNGKDVKASTLFPTWPEEWLRPLEERIDNERKPRQGIKDMFGDEKEISIDFSEGSPFSDTDYVFEKCLGGGGFGAAWLVRNKRMNEQRVFKFCRSTY